jgi:hypothetical protein
MLFDANCKIQMRKVGKKQLVRSILSALTSIYGMVMSCSACFSIVDLPTWRGSEITWILFRDSKILCFHSLICTLFWSSQEIEKNGTLQKNDTNFVKTSRHPDWFLQITDLLKDMRKFQSMRYRQHAVNMPTGYWLETDKSVCNRYVVGMLTACQNFKKRHNNQSSNILHIRVGMSGCVFKI